jgi:hypothetical protein
MTPCGPWRHLEAKPTPFDGYLGEKGTLDEYKRHAGGC